MSWAWFMILLGMLLLLPVDSDEHAEEDELDPFDMVNFDHVQMKMKKKSVKQPGDEEAPREEEIPELQVPKREVEQPRGETIPEDKEMSEGEKIPEDKDKTSSVGEESRPQQQEAVSCPALSLFQQFVSRILLVVKDKVFQEDDKTSTELCLRIALTPQNLVVLENFKKDHSRDRVFTAHDILTRAVKGAYVLHDDDPILRMTWIEEHFGVTVEKALKVLFLFVLVVMAVLLMSKLHLSRNLVIWIFFLSFLASVVLTWIRLYKGEVAKTHNAMMKDLPSGCERLKEEGSPLENIVNFYRNYFTFQQDACVEFYEHIFIDPIVKVSPMEALAVAVVQTVLKPMRTIGTEISEFIRALIKDLPVQWQFVTIVIVFVFIFLALFLSCGYGFRIPFLLAIEPSRCRDDSGDMRALRQGIQDLHAMVESKGPSGSSTHRPALRPSASAPLVQQITSSNITASQPETVRALPLSPSPETSAIAAEVCSTEDSITQRSCETTKKETAKKQPCSGEDGQETDHSVPSPGLAQPVQEVGPLGEDYLPQIAS
ncbi:chloride channel CLIC-like protein 1 [Littorina saxatilis]|uniref:Chloride channel CLIC-like protein 1 n=1 Tax=Littorina saxatilis TaxID=31220 RepID=A0AAN9B8C9_9CAEN